MTTAITPGGRLAGKVALITGAAGNLGSEIVRHYLRQGALVVMSGRTRSRLEAARDAAVADAGVPAEQADIVVMDGADPASVRAGVADVAARHGRIDILVNNAGSAGPRQPIERVPLTDEELQALREAGSTDSETLAQAARNILGVSWNLLRAVAPHLREGASVINVSTIFSRTRYYGRTAYVVPKAALNALSNQAAVELGERGIRVNMVFPGPIRSERIRSVFASMDALKGAESGSTAREYFEMMSLKRAFDGEAPQKDFPIPTDIANTCVFLGSDESSAFNGHDFEVTHGMRVPKESRSTWMNRPTMRSVDGSGHVVLLTAGDQVDEAIGLARLQVEAGAKVVLGLMRDSTCEQARERIAALPQAGRIEVRLFDRTDPATMDAALAEDHGGPISGAIVMPAYGPGRFRGPLSSAGDDDVDQFVDDELGGAIAVARKLSRYWKERSDLVREPRFVFLTNGHDGSAEGSNAWSDLLRAAMEELIRVWRDESEVDVRLGRRRFPEWGNQIIRFENAETENLPFTAGHTARLLYKDQRIDQINLYVPASIVEASGARRATAGFSENLAGLHLGKVALITGGSAGIGGAVARLLALGGARVMMTARRRSELEAVRAKIVRELEDIGYPGAERRVGILADVDVGRLETLRPAVQATIEAFGRIDYLINNAGVSGAEEMAVDMSLKAWNATLDANLVSNYLLMHEVLPLMKKQGSGYVLNVSSYFGGEKYLAVAYPNRSDYAVSKAGQRAMVETMARFLGPEVQFNAIAPGPVEGERLKGTGARPGLFERRGRLILENKRLNAAHAAVVKAMRRGLRVDALLARLAANDVAALAMDGDAPHELRELALAAHKERSTGCTWGSYLFNAGIAERLVARLRTGGAFLDVPEWAERGDGGWLQRLPPEDTPYLPSGAVQDEAAKVRNGVLSLLHLGKMPTETEVALATVYFLADRAVSGETFMPSGGLTLERSITERELFGSAKRERLEMMRGRTVWLIGEHLTEYLAEAARQLVNECQVARVVLLMRTAEGVDAVKAALRDVAPDLIHGHVVGDDLEAGIDSALARHGFPTTIVSTPFVPLPDRLFPTHAHPDAPALSPEEFRQVVQDNLTHHFRVARKASLIDGTQLVLVGPDVPAGKDKLGAGFALANFIKTTLHAFTATVAVENERLVHDVPVNQINLTRRARGEEPRNQTEHLEEVKRFGRAVLLAGAPLPDAEDSRYRARIYRGMSMTV
ncbi:MAG: SDR family NAD(P)-dependent oxidoreductase [Rubrivivax sp.]|nr:SDR family NAD(P)-dependent oxidoreductase [Rubrivivax sp.]